MVSVALALPPGAIAPGDPRCGGAGVRITLMSSLLRCASHVLAPGAVLVAARCCLQCAQLSLLQPLLYLSHWG